MKKLIVAMLLLICVISIHAQRRYGHIPRVKLTKVEMKDSLVSEGMVAKEHNAPILIEKNVPAEIKKIVLPEPQTLALPKIKKPSPAFDKLEVKEVDVLNGSFLIKVLNEHRKLKQVKGTQKNMLRTWKWLMIVASVLVAVGIVLLALINGAKYSLQYPFLIIGICLIVLGVVSAIVILILGLSGRI